MGGARRRRERKCKLQQVQSTDADACAPSRRRCISLSRIGAPWCADRRAARCRKWCRASRAELESRSGKCKAPTRAQVRTAFVQGTGAEAPHAG